MPCMCWYEPNDEEKKQFKDLCVKLVELIKQVGVESDFFKNPEVDFKIAIVSVGLIILAGALAGFFPALKASRVEPITALRES